MLFGPCRATKLVLSVAWSVVTTQAKSSASALFSGETRGRGILAKNGPVHPVVKLSPVSLGVIRVCPNLQLW